MEIDFVQSLAVPFRCRLKRLLLVQDPSRTIYPPSLSSSFPFLLNSSRRLIQLRVEVTGAITILALYSGGQDVLLDLTRDAIPEFDLAAITGAADCGSRGAAAESCK